MNSFLFRLASERFVRRNTPRTNFVLGSQQLWVDPNPFRGMHLNSATRERGDFVCFVYGTGLGSFQGILYECTGI